jgi:hypothetical protein
MKIKIKIDVNGNKKIHLSDLPDRRGFSVQTNQIGRFNLHRLTIGTHKYSDLSACQTIELNQLLGVEKDAWEKKPEFN